MIRVSAGKVKKKAAALVSKAAANASNGISGPRFAASVK